MQSRTSRGPAALLAAVSTLALAAAAPAAAQVSDDIVKLGVLTDMSSLYSDINGKGAVVAVEMAIEDAGGTVLGKKIELVSGDVQNKADVATTISSRWFDVEKVDVILGTAASSSSFATSRVAHEKKKVYLATDPASSDFTGKACNEATIHWVYDTIALANGTGSAVVKAGGKDWFFLTADYAFGHALQRDVEAVVTKSGGRVVGSVRHPLNTSDFSSFLLQAQSSKAQIIGLANAGGDTINSIKQAGEFGITRRGVKIAGLLVFVNDIHALGLQTAQGLVLSETFYWDLNDRTRAFTQRVLPNMPSQNRPSMIQAGCYSATLHYLKAVQAMGVAAAKASGAEAVARMKAMPTNDDCFGEGTIRADGRKLHPCYLFEVKTPAESRGTWDYYKLVATTPADQAFRPIADGGCTLPRS